MRLARKPALVVECDAMRLLWRILRGSRRSFEGSLGLRFALVVAIALLAGASAGVLPAVIGQAVGTIAQGARVPTGPATGFARLVAMLMPAGSAWGIVLVTLGATVITVAIAVFSSRLGSSLSGDVTAAVRIELLQSVLGTSAREIVDAGAALATATAPRGPVPPGKGGPAAPPGKGGPVTPPGKGGPDGGGPGTPVGRGRELVKLAISRESAMFADFAVSVVTGLPQSLATLAVLGYELLVSDAWFALAGGLGLFGISRLLADRVSRRVGEERRAMQNADADVFGDLQEKLATMEDLRLWGARGEALGEFTEVARACARARTRFASALAVSGQIKSVFSAMSPLLIVVALGLAGRAYQAGEVAKLLLVVPLLMSRLEALDALRAGLIERSPLLAAVIKLLSLPPAPPRAADAVTLDLARVAGKLAFEAVSFTPPGASAPVISGLTLTVPAGAVVAICGPSGSGKSSLLRLLLRLDDPDSGEIALDGTDLRRIEPEQMPEIFGVVRQTSQPLERPIRHNLGLGLEPKPSDQAMIRALEQVQLHELVAGSRARSDGDAAAASAAPAAPEGRSLDTEYHAHPPNFSGGEVRRLLLARMLLGPSRVLVLDEPEAGLPSATAEEILAATREHAAGRTVLVVTHAPHLLRSDFNVVLDRGQLVGQGTHQELLERSETYRQLLAESIKGGGPPQPPQRADAPGGSRSPRSTPAT
jgi:ABC-type multidrug transport system fused ATPase/permease subunit